MRLIGIKINQAKTGDHIKRCLKDEWYPFGNYEEPTVENLNDFKLKLQKRCSNGLYYITGDGNKKIDVNISCIVGKNGSGKSTLIDIMMVIINNLTYCHLNTISSRYGCSHKYVDGVNASLYYEHDGRLYEVRDENGNTKLYEFPDMKKSITDSILIDDLTSRLSFGLAFFYTIILDYSLYSHNTNDYKVGEQKEDAVWLHSLFHKNDAYVTPIVLNPFRNKGNIDVNKENHLACQRLAAIAFQLASRNIYDFLPDYKAVNLVYKCNNRYVGVPQQVKDWDFYHEYDEKTKQWIPYQNSPNLILFNYIKNEKVSAMDIRGKRKEELCNYIAYKIMKICKNYADFSDIFDITGCLSEISNAKDNKDRTLACQKYGNAIQNAIDSIESEHSHITYKFHQARNCHFDIPSNDFSEHTAVLSDLAKKTQDQDYWQTFEVLPPPIFEIDVEYLKLNDTNKNDMVRFKTMSSGERQFLFSFSSVIYHVMNISSVIPKDNRIPYHNINLVLDEVELYNHPEYQRTYVSNILNALSNIHILDSLMFINILIVTHSPFILSDICKENTLYLEDGQRIGTELSDSFCANYYDLLLNGFFLKNGAAGAWAAKVFKSITGEDDSTDKLDLNDEQKKRFAKLFGDPLVSGILQEKIIKIKNNNKKS